MNQNSKEDRLLLSRAEELAAACRDQYRITHSEFLDLRQRSLVQGHMKYAGLPEVSFYGGYDGAERVIAVFLPDYIERTDPQDYFSSEPEDNPLTVLCMTKKKGAPGLSHRDYLGALMGLGIRREVTGDILVHEDGADVIVLRSIAEYIETHMTQAGRSGLAITEVPLTDMVVPETNDVEKNTSVASLRLDSVIGTAFGLSRAKAQEAVRGGIVFVNGLEIVKPDYLLREGDKIVLRHKGRAVLRAIGGKTGKGRIHLTLQVYR